MSERRLVSVRRRVPRERWSEYDAAWARLHRAATARGAHAWRFVSGERENLYIEFLEFAAGSDPRSDPEAAAALADLQKSFGDAPPSAAVEEWREVGRG